MDVRKFGLQQVRDQVVFVLPLPIVITSFLYIYPMWSCVGFWDGCTVIPTQCSGSIQKMRLFTKQALGAFFVTEADSSKLVLAHEDSSKVQI